MKFQIGDTIFYKGINKFLSKVQQKVLNTDLSHSSTICGHLWTKDIAMMIPIELEADIKVRIHSYNHGDGKYREVWRWINNELIPQEIIDRVVSDHRNRYEDHWYGFIQWLTIAIRRLFEVLMPKKVDEIRKWNILWGWGTVCSELIWESDTTILDQAIDHWGTKMITAHVNDNRREGYKTNWFVCKVYRNYFDAYNPNTVTPSDLRNIYRQSKMKIRRW